MADSKLRTSVPAGNNQDPASNSRRVSASYTKQSTVRVSLTIQDLLGKKPIILPLTKKCKTIKQKEKPDEWPTILTPARFCRKRGIPAQPHHSKKHGELMRFNNGWLYIFVNGYLWRELRVSYGDRGNLFWDVNLDTELNKDVRPYSGQASGRVLLPVKVQNNDMAIEVGFSEVQWSWVRIESLGGASPKGVERKYWYLDEHTSLNTEGKKLREQRLETYKLAKANKNSYSTTIDNIYPIEKSNIYEFKIDLDKKVPFFGVPNIVSDAKDLALTYQIAWNEMAEYINDLKSTKIKNRKKHPYARWFDTAVLSNAYFFVKHEYPKDFGPKNPKKSLKDTDVLKKVEWKKTQDEIEEWSKKLSLDDIQIALGTKKRITLRRKIVEAKIQLIDFLDYNNVAPEINFFSSNTKSFEKITVNTSYEHYVKPKETDLRAFFDDYATLSAHKETDNDLCSRYIELYNLTTFLISNLSLHEYFLDKGLETVPPNKEQMKKILLENPGTHFLGSIVSQNKKSKDGKSKSHFLCGYLFPAPKKNKSAAAIPVQAANSMFSQEKFSTLALARSSVSTMNHLTNEYIKLLETDYIAETKSRFMDLYLSEADAHRLQASESMKHNPDKPIKTLDGTRNLTPTERETIRNKKFRVSIENFASVDGQITVDGHILIMNPDTTHNNTDVNGNNTSNRKHKRKIFNDLFKKYKLILISDFKLNDSSTVTRVSGVQDGDNNEQRLKQSKNDKQASEFNNPDNKKPKTKDKGKPYYETPKEAAKGHTVVEVEMIGVSKEFIEEMRNKTYVLEKGSAILSGALLMFEAYNAVSLYVALSKVTNPNEKTEAYIRLASSALDAIVGVLGIFDRIVQNRRMAQATAVGHFRFYKEANYFGKMANLLGKPVGIFATGIELWNFVYYAKKGDDAAVTSFVIAFGSAMTTLPQLFTLGLLTVGWVVAIGILIILIGSFILSWIFKVDTYFETWLKQGPFSRPKSFIRTFDSNELKKKLELVVPINSSAYNGIINDSKPRALYKYGHLQTSLGLFYFTKDYKLYEVRTIHGSSFFYAHKFRSTVGGVRIYNEGKLYSTPHYGMANGGKTTLEIGEFGKEFDFRYFIKKHLTGTRADRMDGITDKDVKKYLKKNNKDISTSFTNTDVRWWFTNPQSALHVLQNHLYNPVLQSFGSARRTQADKDFHRMGANLEAKIFIPQYIAGKTKVEVEFWYYPKLHTGDPVQKKGSGKIVPVTKDTSSSRMYKFWVYLPDVYSYRSVGTRTEKRCFLRYRIDVYGDGKLCLPIFPPHELDNQKGNQRMLQVLDVANKTLGINLFAISPKKNWITSPIFKFG